ncbi:G5 domain-containing protein [Ruoffia tabacinasalis]|uniref:LPXTG cell wall anchor domain-containing protein n=1 Tax=Ruoffia tabacinasalis TaxID=87458 RepID=UPI003F9E208E
MTHIIQVGTKEIKTEVKTETVPFETEYVESADLLEVQENIKQKGENGTLLTTYQVTYVNGEEVDREETATEVTVEPTTQIIEKGIRQVKEETKTEVVPFEIERVDNPDMLVGEEKIVQEGVDGERTITENVYFVHGEEVDRQETSNEITLQPIKQIIEVGVKEVKVQDITESIEFETEYIEFETEYIDNADWLEGTQEILTPGANGEVLVTYEITYINGVESARKELNRVILVEPTTQVIEKGTKEAPKPAEGEQNTPGKDKPAKATLPETGEQGSHAIFTAASLAILAGLVVGGRKKEEE